MSKPTNQTPSLRTSPKYIRYWMLLAVALFGMQTAAHAARVLFVTLNAQRDTGKILNILQAQGHVVTVHNTAAAAAGGQGNTLNATNYAGLYDLIVIDEVVGSGAIGNNFKYSPIPVVTWEAFIYGNGRSAFNLAPAPNGSTYTTVADAAAANAGAGSDAGQINQLTSINIVDPSHPLAAGLPAGIVNVFDPAWVSPDVTEGNGVITFAGKRTFITTGVHVAATVPGFANGMTVFGVDAGVINADGTTNLARWVHLPWNDTDQAERVMIEPSFFLFEAGVAWALSLPEPTKIRNLLPEGGSLLSTNTPITFSVDKTTHAGSAVTTGNIHLTFNGVDVISDAQITDGGTVWNVSYTKPLQVNKSYAIVASATANDGGFSARQTSLDTFSESNYSFEAEDWNFGGGQYFDAITLCQTLGGGTANCYYDRLGVTNIDEREINGVVTGTPNSTEAYRYGTGIVREEFVDTWLSADPKTRQKYIDASIPEYEVRNTTTNEWLNYTRSFPAGNYNIYARMSSATAINNQLGLVDNPTSASQTVTNTLGSFKRTSGTVGYEMVPLTDDTGTTTLTVAFDGTPKTLRVTTLGAGTINFYMLVPTTSTVNTPPTVDSIGGVTNGQLIAEGTVRNLTVAITDDGTITNVQYFAIKGGVSTLIGQSVTGPAFTVPWTTPAPGVAKTDYQILATAKDDGGLSASLTVPNVRVINPARIVVTTGDGIGADVELRENDDDTNNVAEDFGVGTGESMNIRHTVATGLTNRHEVIALRFDLGGANMASITAPDLNLYCFRGLAAAALHVYGVTNGTIALDNNGTVHGYTDNNWAETNVSFSTMPGMFWDGLVATQLHTNVADLGVLNIAKQQGEVWSFSSPALTAFLQSHPDTIVTFLIETDTDGTTQYRFAAKEATALQDPPPGPVGSANWYAPFLSYLTVAPTITITSAVRSDNQLTLTWSGGSPPYKIVKRTTINGVETDEVTGIAGTSSPVTISLNGGDAAYYRVQGN